MEENEANGCLYIFVFCTLPFIFVFGSLFKLFDWLKEVTRE